MSHGILKHLSGTAVLLTFSLCSFTHAAIVGGIETNTEQPAELSDPSDKGVGIIAPALHSAVINFDDVAALCFWGDTPDALRTEYAHLGIVFASPVGTYDGGAIMDECGAWGVTGYSPPNMLAFHRGAVGTLSGGGSPVPPQFIYFDPPQEHVQINGGSSQSGDITLDCYSDAGPVGSDSISASTVMQTLSVTATGIEACVVDASPSLTYFVLDDLSFHAVVPPTNQITIDNGFIKLDTSHGTAPSDSSCTDPSHYGRLVADETDGTIYVCSQAGWVNK